MQVTNTIAACVSMALLSGCFPNGAGNVSRSNDSNLRFEAPSGYERLMSPAPHNFVRAQLAEGEPVRRGATSERFDLRAGDCGGSDCANPRARAEIQMTRKTSDAAVGKDIWYGWSFRNATVPSFRRDNSLRLVFGQWKMTGESKAVFRFIQLGKGEGNFAACDRAVCDASNKTGDLVVQLEDIAAANDWGVRQNHGYVCRLFDLEQMRGKWVDIVVNTNFSAGPDGRLRIWVNQELVCNYTGPIVSADSIATGRTPNHRRGIFASWTNRWKKVYGDRPRPNLVVYYDEFRSGDSMIDVDVRHLETASAPPVD